MRITVNTPATPVPARHTAGLASYVRLLLTNTDPNSPEELAALNEMHFSVTFLTVAEAARAQKDYMLPYPPFAMTQDEDTSMGFTMWLMLTPEGELLATD